MDMRRYQTFCQAVVTSYILVIPFIVHSSPISFASMRPLLIGSKGPSSFFGAASHNSLATMFKILGTSILHSQATRPPSIPPSTPTNIVQYFHISMYKDDDVGEGNKEC